MSRAFLPTVAFLLLALGAAVLATGPLLAPDPAKFDPCTTPIRWRLGTVDPRFGVSEAQLRRAVEEAIAVWESEAGRWLFRHDTAGTMLVELVHDERQQAYDRFKAREAELERLREEVDRRQTRLDAALRRVRSDSAAFERSRRESTAARYRESIDRFNAAIHAFNGAVDRYNDAVRAAGRDTGVAVTVGSMERSELTRNGRTAALRRRVTLAYAGSHEETVLILTHELGHALGIGHVALEGAVMAERYRHTELAYPVRLQPEDRAALDALCAEPAG